MVKNVRWGVTLAVTMLVAVGAALGLVSRGAAQGERLVLVSPGEVAFLAAPNAETRQEAGLRLASTDAPIAWTATISPTVAWLSLSATQGTAAAVASGGTEVTIYAESLSLPPNVYATSIIFSAPSDVANTPVIVPVNLYIPVELRQVYLPLIANGALNLRTPGGP